MSKIKEFLVSSETFNASFFIRSTTQLLIWMTIFVLFSLLYKFSNNSDLKAIGFIGSILFGLNSFFIVTSIVTIFHNTYNKISSTFFFILFSIIPVLTLYILIYMQNIFLVDKLNEVLSNVNLN